MNDSLFLRLATLHNLRFMTQLTDRIRQRNHV
jgi:queuine/archaeosine tRNA-ribosyltransferase